MSTRKTRFNGRKLSVICALVATIFAQCLQTSVAVTPITPKPAATKVDLNSEVRTLDNFGSDLFKLDKKSGELGRKNALTRAEFDSLQTSADDLKRRLSELQNALRSIITKLKDAGEWDDIDSRVAATISDGAILTRFRQTSFKRELEELAAEITNHADQISSPVENLRKKVSARAQDPVFQSPGSALAWQSVAVAYHPGPVVVTTGLRCTLAHLRYGASRLVWGAVRAGADEAYNCACNIPSGYSCYSPPTT
jgi:chaperonin cofactor prefoldin